MKKVFLALVVAASFVACDNSGDKPKDTPTTDSTKVVTDSPKTVVADTPKAVVADTIKKEETKKVETEKKETEKSPN
jgi:ABC-type Zn uptake system ZnuABC Zn-binding protein ZnuA